MSGNRLPKPVCLNTGYLNLELKIYSCGGHTASIAPCATSVYNDLGKLVEKVTLSISALALEVAFPIQIGNGDVSGVNEAYQ